MLLLLTLARTARATAQPPAFFLAGDSMTALQSADGGGWGAGFLALLAPPAWGIDYGQDGATTASFVAGGNWTNVLGSVVEASGDGYEAFVTIMVSSACSPRKGGGHRR